MKTKLENSEHWLVQLTANEPQLLRAFRCLEFADNEIDCCSDVDHEVLFRCHRDELWRLGIEFSQSLAPIFWDEVNVQLFESGKQNDSKTRRYPDSLTDFYHHFVSPWIVDAISKRQLTCYRRPIVCASNRNQIMAEEYSLRHEATNGKSIDAQVLFEFAGRHGLHQELHWKVIEGCLSQCYKPLGDRKAFVNVDPVRCYQADYLWSEILDATEENAYDSQSIVFEISLTGNGDNRLLAGFAKDIKQRGFEIALDNWGVENNSMQLLDLVRPDYVKVSEKIVAGDHQDTFRLNLLSGIVQTVNDLGMKAIAEGIACQNDFQRALESGFQWVQGDFIGRPETSSSAPFASSVLPQFCGKGFENTVSGDCQ